jgi:beta-galactosidase
LLCDRIHAETAQVLATYGDDFYAGEPAVTVNVYGAGKAYYLATALDQTFLQPFLQQLCDDQGIVSPLPGVPIGVEVMPRVALDGATQLYVLNHNATPISIPLTAQYHDLLTSSTFDDQLTLPRYGVAILVQPPSNVG